MAGKSPVQSGWSGVMVGGPKSSSLRRRIVLAIAMLMSFRIFQFFPGMLYVQEFWFVLSFLALIVVYPVWKIARGLRFSSLEVYILTLMLVAILLPAWGAWHEFGQPLFYGLMVERGAMLMVSSLLLLNAFRDRLLRPAEIEGALLLCAWGTFVVDTVMRLTLNPANFASSGLAGLAFVVGQGAQAHFVFHDIFILFALIYYALLGFRTRRRKYYLAAAILFASMVGPAGGRGVAVSLAMTLLFFLYRWRPLKDFIIVLARICFIGAVACTLTYIANPAFMAKRIADFSGAFTVVLTGSEVDDPSANARLYETVFALPYIQKNPLLGNGNISQQWQGGSGSVLGAYFYAGDIGIIGAIFTVGVLGMLVFAYQFRFAMRAARELPECICSPLSDAAAGFLLYCALSSVLSAFVVFSPEVTLFFVVILVGLASEGISELRRSVQSTPAIQGLSLAPGKSSFSQGG
jgi:hypothetical protein